MARSTPATNRQVDHPDNTQLIVLRIDDCATDANAEVRAGAE